MRSSRFAMTMTRSTLMAGLASVLFGLAAAGCDGLPSGGRVVNTADGLLTCEAASQRLEAGLSAALAASDQCTSNDECMIASPTIACRGDCGYAVNRSQAAAFEAAGTELSDRYCRQYAPTCGYATPSCAFPTPGCVNGRCRYHATLP
jgi:hypothetical protein